MSGPFTSRNGDAKPHPRADKNPVNDPPGSDHDYDELEIAKSDLDKNLKELAQSYRVLDEVVSDANAELFVDLELTIRHATELARRYFDLADGDRGLSVSALAQRLGYPDLLAHTLAVLRQPQTIESDVQTIDGRRYHLTISPDEGVREVQGAILRFDAIHATDATPHYLKKIVNSLHDPALLLSSDLRVLSANALFFDDFKLRAEHTVGRPLHRIGEGEWQSPKFQNLLAQVVAESRGQESIELTQHFPEVGEKKLKLNVCRLGEEGRILVSIHDLSLQRQLDALRKREIDLQWELSVRARLQEMASAVLQSGTMNDMFYATLDAAIELTGADFSALQVVAERDELELVAQRGFEAQEVSMFLDAAARSDIACSRAFRERRRVAVTDILEDKAYQPFLPVVKSIGLRATQSTPLIGRSGKLLGVLSIIYREPRSFSRRDDYVGDLLALEIADLCEWVKAEKHIRQSETRLRAQSEQLLANDRQKNQFLALLGHELRNPLTVMRNSIQTLVAEEQTLVAQPRVREALALLERQGRHMTHLVNDLLDITRINNGKVVLKRERVFLTRCLDEVMGAHRATLLNRQLHYRLVAPERPIFLDADAARLFQVLDNLITNAIKFTEPGGFIEINMGVEGKWAVIRISDTGIGISPESINSLFDPFTQVDNNLACHGLGLGLSLVKSLVNLHGGSIRAYSEGEDRGSEFVIRWPLHATQDECSTEAAPPTLQLEPTQSSKRILVVDDIADIANSFARLLEVAGHEVLIAYNAQQALELAKKHRPSVAFLDMIMPETDGLQLARLLRRDFDKDVLTLVMVSGYGQSEDVERALQAGIDHHLLKPVEVQQVYSLLDKITTEPDAPHPLI